MSKIADMLAALKDTENPIEDLDAFIAEVDKVHATELSVRDAKVNKTLEDLSAEREVTKNLKVHNYDLIKKIPVNDPNEVPEKPEPEVSGVDSMFES